MNLDFSNLSKLPIDFEPFNEFGEIIEITEKELIYLITHLKCSASNPYNLQLKFQ
jgi:hypothetical protein